VSDWRAATNANFRRIQVRRGISPFSENTPAAGDVDLFLGSMPDFRFDLILLNYEWV